MDDIEIGVILAAARTYWVEILRPTGWEHVHHPDWETGEHYADVMAYAITVRDDHPGEKVRIVERIDGLPDLHVPIN